MLVLSALVLCSAIAFAGTRWASNGVVVCNVDNHQNLPEAVSDGTGGVIVVWQDTRTAGTDYSVYAQRLNSAGQPQWTAGGLQIAAAQGQVTFAQYPYPKIATDDAAGAYIVWTNKSGANWDICARRVLADGSLPWATVNVCGAAGNQRNPVVCADGSGGVLVSWEDQRAGGPWRVYAQRLNSSGVAQWTGDGVALSALASDQQAPCIAADGAGGAVVAWQDDQAPLVLFNIYAMHVDQLGAKDPLFGPNGLPVAASAQPQGTPVLVDSGSQSFVTAFTQDPGGGVTDIYAQKFDLTGAFPWGLSGATVCTAAGMQYEQQIIGDGAGGTYVAWRDQRGAPDYIYAQHLQSGGTPYSGWDPDGLHMAGMGLGNQQSPRLTSDSLTGAYVTWHDYRDDPANPDIYAQRATSGGTRVWGTTGLAICTATGWQGFPVIAGDGSYGAMIAWEDGRNDTPSGTGYDIYAQRTSNDAPTVTGITPAKGLNNSSIDCTVTGTNYYTPGTLAKLKRGNTYITGTNNTVVNSTTLTSRFDLAGKAYGTYDVLVYSGDGQSGSKAGSFTVKSSVPVMETLLPLNATPGDTVTITGGGFGDNQGAGSAGGAASFVSFSGVSATVYSEWTDTRIKCEVPVGAGSGDVSVTTSTGTSNTRTITVVYPTWFLAEGSTSWGFDTYIAIENPNTVGVDAQVTYMTTGGEVDGGTINLPAGSQTTIHPKDLLGEQDFSTRVASLDTSRDICVDRTMTWYSGYGNGNAWHGSVGVTGSAATWYLPEGSSNWGFETWLLIQNPNTVEANCQVTYMIENDVPQTVTHVVPANSRRTYNMADDIGSKDASIMVQADVGVIPERAMYQMSTGQYAVPDSRREGHDSIGTTLPDTDYYLAEGTSAWGFTTYVLIQNPNAVAANVDVTYMTGAGPQPQAQFEMPANSRKTIRVNDVPGMGSVDFSTQVHADAPIIAERAMYWQPGSADSNQAMHDSIGMSAPHKVFYLPDGETFLTDEGPYDIETFTLVQNPNGVAVEIEISYFPEGGGTPVTWKDTVPANSRMTFNMRDRFQANARAAIKVECLTAGRKIMVERSMYMQDRWGGTDTIGGYSD
ncbi:MAG: IPT/TIG domain-containing protein [Actinobacteria bacterium]|nr:IPT/TIG domain-containing protein [Actinomycetota bacterium]